MNLADQRAASVAPKTPGQLTVVLGELSGHIKSLHDLRQRLGMLTDRIMGPRPEAADTPPQPSTDTPTNIIGSFKSLIDEIELQTGNIRHLVSRLEEL